MDKEKIDENVSNELRDILAEAGVGVSSTVFKEKGLAGQYDPSSTEQTATGLRAIIKLAEGKAGNLAFTEEAAHFIIDSLKHNNLPIYNRLYDALSDMDIREILGVEYGAYSEKYNGNTDLLRKEAMGKLLDRAFRGEYGKINTKHQTFVQRIKNFVLAALNKLHLKNIDRKLSDIEETYKDLAQSIIDNKQKIS